MTFQQLRDFLTEVVDAVGWGEVSPVLLLGEDGNRYLAADFGDGVYSDPIITFGKEEEHESTTTEN